jgi:hypothetical protein
MFAAMPPFQILLASVNSGAAARNNFWRLPEKRSFSAHRRAKPEAGSKYV